MPATLRKNLGLVLYRNKETNYIVFSGTVLTLMAKKKVYRAFQCANRPITILFKDWHGVTAIDFMQLKEKKNFLKEGLFDSSKAGDFPFSPQALDNAITQLENGGFLTRDDINGERLAWRYGNRFHAAEGKEEFPQRGRSA